MKERQKRRARRVAITKKLMIFIFIYFSFFTTYFSMITLSKYTGISSGSGTAKVAKWNVSIDTTNANSTLNLVSGNDTNTQSYTLKVISTSEVATGYSIVLSNVPNNMQASIDGGAYKTSSSNKITFNNAGAFNGNDSNTEHSHTVTFKAPLNSNIASVNSIDIDIVFVQKQP